MRIPFFQQRKDINKSTKPKSAHETARDIRLQKIKEYELKLAAKKAADADNQLKNSDLALSVLPNTTTNKDANNNNNNNTLADDATDTNSPGNSDNDDPTVNDDDDEDVDNTNTNNSNTNPHIDTTQNNYHGVPSQLSPISVLSADTKPTLIHPPRSITRDSNGQAIVESNDDNNTSNSNSNTNAISMLCGCI